MGFKPKADKKRAPRAKGEGSIFQRKDGMWVGSIEAGFDEDQAKQALDDLERYVRTGAGDG